MSESIDNTLPFLLFFYPFYSLVEFLIERGIHSFILKFFSNGLDYISSCLPILLRLCVCMCAIYTHT